MNINYSITGNGPPLYMVHGVGSRQSVWDGIVADLAQHFTCVRYDLRGHGQTTVTPPPYTLTQLVDDLENLRRQLGHEKIHIIGHSLGGMIAPAFARQHPARALSVGLISTAAGRNADDRAKLFTVLFEMRERGVEAVVNNLATRWFTDDFITAHPEIIAARIKQVLDTPREVFLSVFEIYADTEMLPWLPEINCPALVLTGALDGACNPRLNRAMAAALPTAELVILDDLKHSILVEAPTRVTTPLKKFLLAQP